MWFAYLSRSDPGLRGNDLDFATYRKNPQSSESFQVLSENAKTCFLLRTVSPSDGDFVIGPCRLQRPGMTAGNRQQ